MATPEHLEILKQGVESWNDWRKGHPDIHPDLSGAYFQQADLSKVDFSSANLSEADFGWAHLGGANLQKSNLSETTLIQTNLNMANLTGATLTGADLANANLSSAVLIDADFTEAILAYTILGDTDLTGAKGLDTCYHYGPSIIDHQTLVISGKLPLEFLQGCGVPDSLIDYLPSLINEPIQRHSVFISYAHQDEAFAQQLRDALQSKGIRCWYAPENIQGGKKIHEQIDEAIRVHDKLLLVLSERSMNSEWVKTEIANARQREISENRRMLFPIRLVNMKRIEAWKCFDADAGKDSAREIREYFIPDFSNWKDHDSFESTFERLLRDLKADDTKTGT